MTDVVSNALLKRTKQIDYAQLEQLCFLGRYQRRIPVSIQRMIENAYDWEHLPFVHSSTFSDISLIDSGNWGWQAELGSAKSNGQDRSIIELLVDQDKNYWATTVLTGKGTGVEIHTQATAVGAAEIEIDVRFYLPQKTAWLYRKLAYWVLRRQYHQLYEEDSALMVSRQKALDENKRWRKNAISPGQRASAGAQASLDKQATHCIETLQGRYVLQYWQDQWRAYSATCPHQLGQLDSAAISDDGVITCPWHGYRFSVATGTNLDQKCAALETPTIVINNGELFLEFES